MIHRNLNIKLSPEDHRQLMTDAATNGMSMTDWVLFRLGIKNKDELKEKNETTRKRRVRANEEFHAGRGYGNDRG